CFGKAGADLFGDGHRFGFRRSPALEPGCQRFSVEVLHRDEIPLALLRGSRVDFEDLANVGVADFASVPDLRGKPLPEAGLGTLDSNAAIKSKVESLVDDAHAALSYLAYNSEAAFD